MSDERDRKRRAGGKARRSTGFEQMLWAPPLMPDAATGPLDAEGIARIDATALRILAEIGVEIPHPEACALLEAAGCRINGANVRMEADFLRDMLARAPASFTLTPRNPDRALEIGTGRMVFGAVASPAHAWDLERGKRPGDFETYRDFLKLVQHFNCIHLSNGYPVEPVDVPPAVRHLDCLFDMLTLTDKLVHAYALGPAEIEDAIEMVRLAAGLTPSEFAAAPRMFTNINSVSPLKHDVNMIDGALRLARAGQAVVVTPVTLAGTTAPVTLAGAVALALAEALSAIALLQLAAPGAPVVLGSFTSKADLRSGMPVFGTAENMRATQMAGQMARHYRLPFRSSGVCTANIPDGQAMWETSNSLWSAVQSRSDMVFHAAGWLEGGMTASPEKFVMDCELLQGLQRYAAPALCATGPDDLAFDTIREVGAGGHFFGTRHTQDRPTPAPLLSDWRSYEAWAQDGKTWTSERAHRVYRQILQDYEPPAMDGAAQEALTGFVMARKQAITGGTGG